VLKILACVDLRICNIQWERLSEQGSVIRHYIVLFSLYVFSYVVIKRFLMRQYVHKMMSISRFFHMIFIREIRKTYYVDSVSSNFYMVLLICFMELL
jgi:hypothetical protein